MATVTATDGVLKIGPDDDGFFSDGEGKVAAKDRARQLRGQAMRALAAAGYSDVAFIQGDEHAVLFEKMPGGPPYFVANRGGISIDAFLTLKQAIKALEGDK